MNRCGTYYPLSPHLDTLLWCHYVFSQARSSQRWRFRVVLPKLLNAWKRVFLELFARLQTRDISDMSPNPFTWWWQFFLLAESTRHLSAYVGVDFSCKTVGMRNGMAQIGLKTNSSGDVLLEKGKSSIVAMNLLAQIICCCLMIF